MIGLTGLFIYVLTCAEVTQYVSTASDKEVRAVFNIIYKQCPQEAMRIPCGFPILQVSQIDVRSGYGMRYHPIDKVNKEHFGIDLASPQNPIMATGFGRVSYAGHKGAYGLHVEIDHGNSYTTSYSHLSEIYITNGDYIEIAQEIGKVGSSGKSTGNHLHYEVKKNGQHVNPADYLLLFYKATAN